MRCASRRWQGDWASLGDRVAASRRRTIALACWMLLDAGQPVSLTLSGERNAQTWSAGDGRRLVATDRQRVRGQAGAGCAGRAMKINVRDIPPRAAWTLEQGGVHPLLARLYAARGVLGMHELDDGLALLLPPVAHERDWAKPRRCWPTAWRRGRKLCIVADYDCDGATACAVACAGCGLLGARHVDYLVPDRVVDGYGLTPAIAQRVKARGADLLITVDNGIASVEGVAAANALGLQVLVTDHHLPGPQLPEAAVIVNPNQAGLRFRQQVHRRRRRDLLRAAGVAFGVAPARRVRAAQPAEARQPVAAGRARHGRRRGAGSMPTTAAWWRRA